MKAAARKNLGCLLLLILAIGLNFLAPQAPDLVEALYSRGLYPLIGQALSRLTRLIPFSLAEVVAVLLLLGGPIVFIWWLLAARRKPVILVKGLWRLLVSVATLYASFVLVWGLNYHRLPLAEISGLPVQPSTTAELVSLCEDLLHKATVVRESLYEDANGVMTLTGGKWRALSRAALGYQEAAKKLPAIGGTYGSPKGVYLSGPWSYTGIAGMYFPYTGEANVNMAQPDPYIPSAACHEMAHQRGFAREDEANYLAYLTCTSHPDAEFQYSGLLLALTHASRALRVQNAEAHAELISRYSPELVRDLTAHRDYWNRYSGPVERISNEINDNYLKSQGQKDGVQSYGRMVDLLLAEQRLRNK